MKLYKSKLRRWAESKEPGEVIGYALVPDQCPLAQYLNEMEPVAQEHWHVSGQQIVRVKGVWDTVRFAQATGPLALNIIRAVDRYGVWNGITAEEFLALLDDL